MNDAIAQPSQDSADPSPVSLNTAPMPAKSRWRSFFTLLALLLAIAAGGTSYLIWRELTYANESLTQRLTEVESGVAALREQTQDVRRDVMAKLTASLKGVQAEQQNLQTSLATLHSQMRKSGATQALAEAEYLLRIANHRLLLERDVHGALQALALAEQRLQESGDPVALTIREKLNEELNALLAVKPPDLAELTRILADLSERVPELPLFGRTQPSPVADKAPQPESWRAGLYKLWSDISNLIVIRHSNKGAPSLLSPNQEFFLRQNLRLELTTARLALLQEDTQAFRGSLTSLRALLESQFDTEAMAVQDVLKTLAKLEKINLRPALPQISASLQLLEDRMRQDTTPAGAVENPSHNAGSEDAPSALKPEVTQP